MLRLNLFGTASIGADGGFVTGRAAQGRRMALLALLACTRTRCLTRDKLIALLWPEASTERARRQLSDDVYIVRSALGDDVLRSSGDELSLDPAAITSDVERFEKLLDEGHLEAAVELVAGPLLDGFHLSDAAEFERWLDAERTRLAQRHATALQSLAEANEARGQFTDAAAWWRTLAAQDAYSGRVALRLMLALEAAGDRAGALRHARIHAALLRDEFDAEPDAEVAALAERLRVVSTPRVTHPPPAAMADARAAATPAPRLDVTDAPPPGGTSGPAAAPVDHRQHDRLRATPRYVAALVLLLVIAAAGAFVAARPDPAGPLPLAHAAEASVGVLPFVNMSGAVENTYFSDGLTEQIITVLSHIEGLQVAARTSSFALRDGRHNVRAIGEILGVAAVLEGSVRTDGTRLRITAQLIDAVTGYHIWSDIYDREIEDVFAVQDEIAAAIAAALELRLAPRAMATADRVVDLEAYDLYLRGLHMRNTLTADALRQAIDCFDRAIARQPDFALAYAAKASVIGPLILFGHMPQEAGLKEYRALTARALELDSSLGEAHAVLGIQKLFFDWEWDAAERALRRAIELNPNDAHAYHHLGNYYRVMRRPAEAAAARARAVELDPLNARTIVLLAGDYAVLENYELATAMYERARKLDPVHPLTLGSGPWLPNNVANLHLQQGREPEAVDEFVRIAAVRGASRDELDALRSGFVADGMPGFWRSWMAMDLRLEGEVSPDPFRMAKLLLLSGDTAAAFDRLDRAHAQRNPALIMLNADALFDGLRDHPRVARILRSMRFL